MCAKHPPLYTHPSSSSTSTTLFCTSLPLSTRITSSSSASTHALLLLSTRSSSSVYAHHLLFLRLAFSIPLNSFSPLEASSFISRITCWRAAVSLASMSGPAVFTVAPSIASSIISSTSTSTLCFAPAHAVSRASTPVPRASSPAVPHPFTPAVPHASALEGSFKFACFKCSVLFDDIVTARYHFSHNPHRIPAKKRKYSEADLEDFIDRRLQGTWVTKASEVAQIVASTPNVKTELATARALVRARILLPCLAPADEGRKRIKNSRKNVFSTNSRSDITRQRRLVP